NGRWVAVDGPVDLARKLVDSREVQAAFVSKCFQYLSRQPIRGYGENAHKDLMRAFVSGKYGVRNLTAEAAVLAALPVPVGSKVSQAQSHDVSVGARSGRTQP
ncbi:MAG: hypothetical protein ACOVT5_01070, partial [Armatimonadaceae bacterium]